MAATMQNMYERTFTSFGGPDIVPIFNNKVIGECQAITYSIRREKAPIYTFGSADPRAYARGKRGIAGSVVFAQFDRHALLEELQAVRGGKGNTTSRQLFASDSKEEVPYSDQGVTLPAANAEAQILGVDSWGHQMTTQIASKNGGAFINFEQLLSQTFHRTYAWYADQLPAFHITLTMANEMGQAAAMRILYAEILNEGVGMSVDDTVIEQAMTFVARKIIPIRAASSEFKPPASNVENARQLGG